MNIKMHLFNTIIPRIFFWQAPIDERRHPDVTEGEQDLSNSNGSPAGQLDESDILSLLLAFTIRHGLSKVALGDLLDLLRVLGVTDCVPMSRYKLLKHIVEDIGAQNATHFYCSSCSAYVKADWEACGVCDTPFDRATSFKEGNYFVYVPLYDQIKELLESGYVSHHMHDGTLGRVGNDLNGARHQCGSELNTLSLSWNFDGLPIFKSSGATVWPILAQINELSPEARKEELLLCGVWFGTKKPNWLSYSKPFMEELKVLGTEGIRWQCGTDAKITKVVTHAIVCDAPARCMVQGTHQFNGAYGCTWCLQEGRVVQKGNGYTRVYEHITDVPKRTHNGVLESAKAVVEGDLEHHEGVRLATPLLALPDACGVDAVRSFSVDYMHAVLLGIVRQVLELWFGSKWSSFPFSIRSSLNDVDARLLSIRPPQDISRTPRTLKECGHWKASECRNWLLFYSVSCLSGIMRPKYLQHWCLLVNAVYVLLQDNVSEEDLSYADRNLQLFSSGMEALYGRENMTSNVHASTHLSDCVRNLGPLWACSAFPFEGFMMNIKKFIKGTTRIPQQVVSTYLMLKVVKKHNRNGVGPVSTLVRQWLGGKAPADRVICSDDGAVGLNVFQTRPLSSAESRLLVSNGYSMPIEGTGRYVNRAIIGGSVVCTRSGKTGKRNSCMLFTHCGLGCVESICFLEVDGKLKCFLFLRKNETSHFASLRHAWKVTETNALVLCRPSEVHCNAVVTNARVNGQDVSVCSRQPNHVEKD